MMLDTSSSINQDLIRHYGSINLNRVMMILQKYIFNCRETILYNTIGKSAQGHVRSEIRWLGNIMNMLNTPFNAFKLVKCL